MSGQKPKRRLRVQSSSTTKTYVYCKIASFDALKRAEEVQSGGLYFCMMAAVFASFTVEAFLNHIGQARIKDWDALDASLGRGRSYFCFDNS